jgi:hypothetical protein
MGNHLGTSTRGGVGGPLSKITEKNRPAETSDFDGPGPFFGSFSTFFVEGGVPGRAVPGPWRLSEGLKKGRFQWWMETFLQQMQMAIPGGAQWPQPVLLAPIGGPDAQFMQGRPLGRWVHGQSGWFRATASPRQKGRFV